ncbi:MAG: hypothetical protein AB7O44_30390 [Hyphomicrobiaceae bacterium]
MESAEARDNMVKRVHACRAKFPNFGDIPLVEEAAGDYSVSLPSMSEAGYISALYAVCANGHMIGRTATGIVGKIKRNPGQTKPTGATHGFSVGQATSEQIKAAKKKPRA